LSSPSGDGSPVEQIPGSVLANYIQHVEDLDSILVAAFETLFKDQPDVKPIEEADDIIEVNDDFMILDGRDFANIHFFLDSNIRFATKYPYK